MLEPDRDLIEIFVDALFRHAGREGFVSLRAFYEDDSAKPFRITPTALAGGLRHVIDAAEDDARRAANDRKRVVFCAPLAVFCNRERARESDIALGLALSVECDHHPREALAKLEPIIGPPTLIVASGGKWTDPATGQAHDKWHLHWRLAVPAKGEALRKLKQARDLAARLVGGDPSNKPVCHPIRWAGSLHRKAEPPRLCEIEDANPDREIDLDAALAALITASSTQAEKPKGNGQDTGTSSTDWATALQGIASGESYHGALVPLAMKLLAAGMADGAAVNILRAQMEASTGARDDRWQSRYNDIPRAVRTAREKFEHDAKPQHDAPTPSAWRFHADAEPQPTAWLIKNILPETGTGLISGQWGTFKTTVALDLALSAMAGPPFAGKFMVKRKGGVIYFAVEGAPGLSSRLTALEHRRGISGALPFAYRSDCPPLTAPGALDQLAAMVKAAAKDLYDKFGVPPVLIFIDTIITAAGYAKAGEENDAAAAQRTMSVLARLSQQTDALVLGVAHFGKMVETGTRGSSAFEAAADVVLALLVDKETNGTVSNTRLAVRKEREGVAGLEIPFMAKDTLTGTDPDGEAITRVVIDWQSAPAQQTHGDKDWSKSLQLLRRILMAAMVDGVDVQPFLDGPIVRACGLDRVRAEFNKQYFADGDARQKADARRKAFKRAVADAQAKSLIAVREINGTQMVWLVKTGQGADA
jgi:AAA domain-containing protein